MIYMYMFSYPGKEISEMMSMPIPVLIDLFRR